MGSENELNLEEICGRYFKAHADLADTVKAERAADIARAQA